MDSLVGLAMWGAFLSFAVEKKISNRKSQVFISVIKSNVILVYYMAVNVYSKMLIC